MRRWVLLALLLPMMAFGAVRDFTVNWTQDCSTVQGDDLDLDDDGICEMLTGFRIYDAESGDFVEGIPEDGTRQHVFSYNDSYGSQCFQMTAIMDVGGATEESALSNVGGCMNVTPLGVPTAPVVE